jgi:hypothetical protein
MAENLWALREQKKLSVATLASRAGLPIGLIMEYEAGQRSIDPRHLARLARALYVEEADLRLHSDPRPGTGQLERQSRSGPVGHPPAPSAGPSAGPVSTPPGGGAIAGAPPPGIPRSPRERTSRPPRPAAPPRPPAPARPSQIAHLQDVLARLGRTQTQVEAELGKPLAEIDRPTASKLLTELQAELREGRSAERHRAYLPEAVDQYEARYLTAAQEAAMPLRFTLFDNSTVTGVISGFGPYNITVRQPDGGEVTLNKLAIVSYAKPSTAGTNGKEPHA